MTAIVVSLCCSCSTVMETSLHMRHDGPTLKCLDHSDPTAQWKPGIGPQIFAAHLGF